MNTFVIHLDPSPHCALIIDRLIIDSIFVFIKINLQVDEQMLLCKQRLIVEKLRELRATSPTFPMVSKLDLTRATPKRSTSAPPPPSPGPVATGFLASSPSTPAPMPIHPVDSPSTLFSSAVQCMSCTALEKRAEGLELAVRRLQAQMSQMSLHHNSSTATQQATSSAALASPSPSTSITRLTARLYVERVHEHWADSGTESTAPTLRTVFLFILLGRGPPQYMNKCLIVDRVIVLFTDEVSFLIRKSNVQINLNT